MYDELKVELDKNFDYLFNNMKQRLKILNYEIFRENNEQYKIGIRSELMDFVPSPYSELRDKILGQYNFQEKQINIIKLCNKYTREANISNEESEHWLYCKESNRKLIPVFFKTLADTYINNYIDNYDIYSNKLNEIIGEIGTMVDDAYVDKYSGFEIKKIQINNIDEYDDDGYKIINNSVLEKEITNLDTKQIFNDKEVKYTGQALKVFQVIKGLNNALQVDLYKNEEIIIRNSIDSTTKEIFTEKKYNKIIETDKKLGKKLDPYSKYVNEMLLWNILSYYIIVIQSLKNIEENNYTYPNCVKNFDGFPLRNNKDLSTLKYIACVVIKIKNNQDPWNGFTKYKEDNIPIMITTLEKKITDIMQNNPEMNNLIHQKLIYLKNNIKPQINIQINNNWDTFLPPLKIFKIKSLQNITQQFKKELANKIEKGDKNQNIQINMLLTKIYFFSLLIQSNIQDIVNKKNPLISYYGKNVSIDKKTNTEIVKNERKYFIQNFCCNEDFFNAIDYFNNVDKSILKNNEIIDELSELYSFYKSLNRPTLFADPYDTKIHYPKIMNDFNEETIYLAFIKYCKYNTNIPLEHELKQICIKNESSFNKLDNIQNKIEILKKEDIHYSIEDFEKLLHYFGNKNKIDIDFNSISKSPIDKFRDCVNFFTNNSDININPKLIELLNSLMSSFDNNSGIDKENKIVDDIRNFLIDTNNNNKNMILNFIKKYGLSIKTSEIFYKKTGNKKNIETFIDTLSNYTFENDEIYNIKSIIDFYNYIILFTCRIAPNLIINQINLKDTSNIKKSRNIKLSLGDKHITNLENILDNDYNSLYKFFNNDTLEPVLKHFKHINSDLYLLSILTPFINENDKYNYVFNNKFILDLYKYYFLEILAMLISYEDNKNPITKILEIKKEKEEELDISDEGSHLPNLPNLDINEQDEFESDHKNKSINRIIADFISTLILNKFYDDKKSIHVNITEIKQNIRITKEEEVKKITTDFNKLTIDERKAQDKLKILKLGKWAKGLSKGITQYDKEFYDEEMETIENKINMDKELGSYSQVSEMYLDAISAMRHQLNNALDLEDEENKISEEEINRENNDLSNIPDDEGDQFYNDSDEE